MSGLGISELIAVIEPIVTAFRSRVPDQCLTWLTKDESRANWQKWFQRDHANGQFLLVAELESQTPPSAFL